MRANMRKIILAALLLICSPAALAVCYPSAAISAGQPQSFDCVEVQGYVNSAGQSAAVTWVDPCENPNVVTVTAGINISTATTTAIVAAVAGKSIYLCSFNATANGTTPAFTFIAGTQTSTPCDTGASTLSGAFAPTAGSFVSLTSQGIILKTAASQQLCLTSGGTTPSIQGIISYAQQ